MAFPTNPDIGDTHVEFDTTWTYGTTGWYRTIIGSSNETFYDFSRRRAKAAGIDGDVQLNSGDYLGAVAGLRWDPSALSVPGDLNLDDGGAFQTTLQLVTPTANRTVTFPDATGTVGLVAGSSGNLVVNQSGAYAGVANSSVDDATGNITLGSRFISSLNGAASAPPATLTGTWFTGGTATTTKPQLLLEPAGTTSTAWSTAGTGLGINATSGFTGQLLDAQVNGTSRMVLTGAGRLGINRVAPSAALDVLGQAWFDHSAVDAVNVFRDGTKVGDIGGAAAGASFSFRSNTATPYSFSVGSTEVIRVDTSGRLGIGTTGPTTLLDVNSNAVRLRTARTPASAAATGAVGEISWDADYIYVCTATDTWKRAALSTW
jgi:hypothetical protein